MKKKKIKTCPFCGETPILDETTSSVSHEDESCPISGMVFPVKVWNDRRTKPIEIPLVRFDSSTEFWENAIADSFVGTSKHIRRFLDYCKEIDELPTWESAHVYMSNRAEKDKYMRPEIKVKCRSEILHVFLADELEEEEEE